LSLRHPPCCPRGVSEDRSRVTLRSKNNNPLHVAQPRFRSLRAASKYPFFCVPSCPRRGLCSGAFLISSGSSCELEPTVCAPAPGLVRRLWHFSARVGAGDAVLRCSHYIAGSMTSSFQGSQVEVRSCQMKNSTDMSIISVQSASSGH
jgi:hypothetical protein